MSRCIPGSAMQNDETESLLRDSFRSLDSVSSGIGPQILSPKNSFYKQFKHDTMERSMGDILKNAVHESPGGATDLASVASIPRWSFPIDFDLWGKSILNKPGSTVGLKRFLLYSERTGILQSSSFESLKLSRDPGDVLSGTMFWLDVNLPTANEMNLLGKIFGIHPLTIEDIQTEDTREKCEVFPNYYFVTISTFDPNLLGISYMKGLNFYLIIFKECVLTVISFLICSFIIILLNILKMY